MWGLDTLKFQVTTKLVNLVYPERHKEIAIYYCYAQRCAVAAFYNMGVPKKKCIFYFK